MKFSFLRQKKLICPHCGGTAKRSFDCKDYNRRITEETFSYYCCDSCKLIFVAPVPPNLSAYYSSEYHFIPESVDFLDQNSGAERYKVDMIMEYAGGGRLLEVGPSMGAFSFLAKKSGFEVTAIEMDASCAKFLQEKVGIRAICSDDVISALEPLGRFDVICLWHVIEHLPNPWEVLSALQRSLAPGGVLVLAAPNPSALQFKLLGKYWPHVDAPRHLALIPSASVIQHMRALGMRLELCTTTDEGGKAWDIFGWEHFFINLRLPALLGRLARRFGVLLARIMRFFEEKNGRGSAYTMVFRNNA